MITFLVTSAVALLSYGIFAAYQSRKLVAHLRTQGKPMPPWSWYFGHLLVIKEYLDQLPADTVFNYVAMSISQNFTKQHMFYLDFWPFTIPVLVVSNPHAADQIMRHAWVQKPQNVFNAFMQMSGGPNLITMPEDPWKRWRTIFNPGFGSGYILEAVPKLVDQGQIFCEKLRLHAKSEEMFPLEEATFRLAIDVIGLVGMQVKYIHLARTARADKLSRDYDFNYQSKDSSFPETMRSLIEIVNWGQEMNPLKRWSLIRRFQVWSWGRYLNSFIHAELEKRFAERMASKETHEQLDVKGRKVKSIVALALDNYIAEDTKKETATMDPDFKRYATAQLRVFLVAGHDTTSSAITYSLHLLHTHPSFLARVRNEHDSVFGTDINAAAALLKGNPNLLNRLPLTLAAIKEALRLFPPAGGIRMGSPEVTLTAEDGTQFPTAGCQVWIVHEALHRNPAYWKEPDAYIPDRWLVGPEDPLFPVKGAWRAFEHGPHNCIGQNLALTEIKTILVITLREFDMSPAYDEWDRLHPSKGIKMFRGNRAYQVANGGGGQHPADRYPCRISVRGE